MSRGEPTPTLIRNLIAARREAVEELLVVVQSFAPALFVEASEAAAEARRHPAAPRAFVEMRALYSRVVDDFQQTAQQGIVDGRFAEVLERSADLAWSLAPSLRDEILLQQGRARDLAERERRGLVDGATERNRLRADLLNTLHSLIAAVRLPPETSTEPSPPRSDRNKAQAERSSPAARSIIGAEMNVLLRCARLGKRYPRSSAYALRDVTIQLQSGMILGVLGLNGSGKSTLLRILAGELAYDCGTLDWCGLRRRDIAFVPQTVRPWAGTLGDHLHEHAAYYGHTGTKNAKDVRETLILLDLESFVGRTFGELSGGVQTRCALAEALVTRPKVLVLDEPLAALDPVAQYRFLADLHAHAKYAARKLPAVVSSQHVEAIEDFADEVLLLQEGVPVTHCAQWEIGEDRTDNVFELRCLAEEETLWSALGHLVLYSIVARPDGRASPRGGRYEIRVARDVPASAILDSLRERQVALDYFADVSRSSLSRLMQHA